MNIYGQGNRVSGNVLSSGNEISSIGMSTNEMLNFKTSTLRPLSSEQTDPNSCIFVEEIELKTT